MALGETYQDRQSFLEDDAIYDGATAIKVSMRRRHSISEVGLVGVSWNEPYAWADASDVAASPAGKTLTVNGVNYVIIRGEPDDTGMTRLVLRES